MDKTIIIRGQYYYLFDEYGTREMAYKIAKEFKKERGVKYFVLQSKDSDLLGSIIPTEKFSVYFDKKLRLL